MEMSPAHAPMSLDATIGSSDGDDGQGSVGFEADDRHGGAPYAIRCCRNQASAAWLAGSNNLSTAAPTPTATARRRNTS